MSFLPDNYEQPQGGGSYTRLKLGENRIRIVSNSILGWLGWTIDNKPVRVRYDNRNELTSLSNLKDKPRHFWAFLVWNYNTQSIEVFEITQKTIQDSIMTLYRTSDWGDPKDYDIIINKQGDGMDTAYSVQGAPKSQFEPQKVKEAFNNKPCNLEALFDGADPFDLDDQLKSAVIKEFNNQISGMLAI